MKSRTTSKSSKTRKPAGSKLVMKANPVSYELMLVLKPLLPEDVRGKLINSITDQVADAGGKVELKDNWGKRHMAYVINGHEEGYYLIYRVTMPSSGAVKLRQAMQLMPDILRFLLVKESEL